MKAHKFIHNGAVETYAVVVFCEYCGAITFHGNEPRNEEYGKVRGTECPNGVELQTVKESK